MSLSRREPSPQWAKSRTRRRGRDAAQKATHWSATTGSASTCSKH